MTNEVTLCHKNIEKAMQSPNPMKELPNYEFYKKDGFQCYIICRWKNGIDQSDIKWAFRLAERNVGPYYKTCRVGWQPKVKYADLNKSWARYIIAREAKTNKKIGYCMFRFDLDYGSSVLYCYEMQIEEEFQRKGLGAFLLQAMEDIAKLWKMEKLVLTVLKNNPGALKFYETKDFKVDDTSPDDEDYQIMSKVYSKASPVSVASVCEE